MYEFQVQSREREVQHSRDVKEDFTARLKDISEKVSGISLKLKQKSVDVEEAKEETEVLQCPLHTQGSFDSFPTEQAALEKTRLQRESNSSLNRKNSFSSELTMRKQVDSGSK